MLRSPSGKMFTHGTDSTILANPRPAQQDCAIPINQAMKSAAFFISALVAAGLLRADGPAMPPDPLVQSLVPVPLSTADLVVRGMTQAAGVSLWRLAGELEAMTTAQVRTITFGAWRAYRRFHAGALYAANAG